MDKLQAHIFSKAKSQALKYLKYMVLTMEQDIGNKLTNSQSHKGGEFYSIEFDQFLLENKIAREINALYGLEKNGYIERDNRIVIKAARA